MEKTEEYKTGSKGYKTKIPFKIVCQVLYMK